MAVDPRQLTLVKTDDPTGNGQPAYEVVLQADAGSLGAGLYFVQHGGQLLRAVHGNPSPSDEAAAHFELDGGRLLLQEL